MDTDVDTIWSWTHAERRALAATLAGLSDDEWARPSLCEGWSVRDVAAHVIAHPQTGWRELAGMSLRNLGRGYNATVRREVQRLGRTRSPEQILADFTTYDGSRRKVPVTTVREPLIDALVHHQDIVRPLGRRHDPDPVAAGVAADRALTLAFLSGARTAKRRVRLVATDHDWSHGTGPVVEGRMVELLLVTMGRQRAAVGLTGAGVQLLPR